ncbi:MAG: pilus assembly protein [Hyphomicrobium sp.]|uniref:TadE/TadG family type IV pilus assembly protein n=1 Tax=Hyphomicrobium sp. TaxID=82 RepID=UPI0039E5059F
MLEFAFVVTPFLMFIFGFVGCALYFFVANSLENGMDQTSRLIRTGEAITDNMTVDQFKQKVCSGAGTWVDCNKLQIWAQHWSDWSDPTLAPHQCVDSNNAVIHNNASGTDPIATYSGGASDVVIVTLCYQWDFANKIPYLHLGNMQNGSMMMQTSTAFRTEPYPGASS